MSEETQHNGNGHTSAEVRSLASIVLDRINFMRQAGITFDGDRDLYKILGYARTLTNRDFRDRYSRGGIAGRVVDAFPDATWRGQFEVIEDDNPKKKTKFEQSWADFAKRLRVKSILRRADILTGLSTYSVLLIGAKGRLSEELPNGSGKQENILYLQPYMGGGGVNNRSQITTVDCDVSIQEYETDSENPRFGLPKQYQLRRTDFTAPNFNVPVHWTRIIHLAEGVLDDEVFGQPALERVWNLLDDLDKVTGGGAEAFWLRANQGLHINFDKDMADLKPDKIQQLKDNLQDYQHGITRFIRTRGTEIETLGSDVANFSNPADSILTQIAGAKKIPKRILTGSEMGELASSQDRDNWKDQVNGRQTSYAGPYIVQPLVDRLIEYNYLPAPINPDGYEIRWPMMQTMTEDEKAKGAQAWATTNSTLKGAGLKPAYTSEEIRDHWHQFEPLTDKELEADTIETPEEKLAKINQESKPIPSEPQPQKEEIDPKTGKPILKAAEHAFSSTQINIPESHVDTKIFPIDDEDLISREDTPHVTVKYGIHTNNADVVQAILRDEPPIDLTLGVTNHFVHHDYDVVYVTVSSECLQRLNEHISKTLAVSDEHQLYTPHLTIAYVVPGAGAKYDGREDFAGLKFSTDTVVFNSADDETTEIQLTGQPEYNASEEMVEVLAEAIEANNTDIIDRLLGIRHASDHKQEIKNFVAWVQEQLKAGNITLDTPLVEILEQYESTQRTLGGQGSGNFNHKGRPGEIGGSSGGSFTVENEGDTGYSEKHIYQAGHLVDALITAFGPDWIGNAHKLAKQGYTLRDLMYADANTLKMVVKMRAAGGPGSGDFGHAGRPGEVGGSAEGFARATGADKERLKALGVPPNAKNIRVNPDPKGRLQAVYQDSKDRWQRKYSAQHTARQSVAKFDRSKEFNKQLPALRSQVRRDMKNGNDEANVIYLIDKTGFRVGGDGDTKADKQAYGASTLTARHVKIDGDDVSFSFTGKKGVTIEKTVTDRTLAKMLAPKVKAGGRLFDTGYHQVRDYMRKNAPGFTPKDFRTWHATSLAMRAVNTFDKPRNAAEFKQYRREVAKEISEYLGNTPEVALKDYINPEVFDRWDKK